MPLDTIVVDLWDWDVHFEEQLTDDWYFDAVFGPAESLDICAEQLAVFFLEQCRELALDYDQRQNDSQFEAFVEEQAKIFVSGWRANVCNRYAQRIAPADAREPARR